jgi:uncharacterized lipoprotein YmbA
MRRTRQALAATAPVLALLLALLLAAAGCRSAPTRFYTLAPVAGTAVAPGSAAAPLQVSAVHMPAFLDRQERVSRLSPQQLQVHDDQHWAEPLDSMAQRVLTQDLAARLPAGTVLDPRLPPPPGTRRIVVEVQEFQPEPDGTALLQGTWTVHSGDSGAVQNHTFQYRLPGGADADAQVAAMDRLLGQVADEMARALAGNGNQR